MILDFIRNKIVEVEPLPDGSLRVSWNLKDSLLEAEVKLGVRPPDLEITETFARLKRFPHQKCLLAIGSHKRRSNRIWTSQNRAGTAGWAPRMRPHVQRRSGGR